MMISVKSGSDGPFYARPPIKFSIMTHKVYAQYTPRVFDALGNLTIGP